MAFYSDRIRFKFVSAAVTGTGVVANSTVNISSEVFAFDSFAVRAKGTGAAPTTLTAAVQGSLDGTNWTDLQAITQANDGTVLYATGKLTQYLRINVTALTLGSATNVIFSIIAA